MRDQDVVMTWKYDDADVKMKFIVTMTLQLPSFLDANSVERVTIDVCTGQGEERHPKDYFRTNISH